MAPKMVSSFRRSLSFQSHTSHSKPKKTLHARSASLPCPSHPITFQLRDKIDDLKDWAVMESGARTSGWLCDGLARMKMVHDLLDDLLQLPQTRDSLRGGGQHPDLLEKLLEDFLRFVEVYSMFNTLVLRLKEECTAAQIAVRRRDDSKIAVHSKNLNRIGKEISNLVCTFHCMGKLSMPASHDGEAELIEVVNDVIEVTRVISATVFGGISNSSAFRKPSSIGISFKKKVKSEEGIKELEEINLDDLLGLRKKTEESVKNVSKKMHEMEDCIMEIEGSGERVFRSLINARVSLLNILTQ
ncbi:hypothetical protein F511_00948 [Dorcoceras hygrometricum]|uniref:DUF241 domain protein n=1 Tax=Dorcoceras hygrometricum TaxID=472368 RepID=A0A2Z7ALM0_9LAMI|nr:hypothetical protein F511_00948 [Dorcoceras hygrometricum]